MSNLVGLLPAAGKGLRAYPHTATVPKSMLEVDGTPNLQRNIELLRDQLSIRDIRIVVGYQGEVIQRHFGDGARLGVRIRYIANDRPDLELPYSIYLGTRDLSTPSCMLLADECYVGSNHAGLLAAAQDDALVVCGLIRAEYAKEIRKNYVVTQRDGFIVDLQEKPHVVTDRLMGTGTYLLQPALYRRLADAFEPDLERGPRDWTTWLAGLARGGVPVRPFLLTGQYVNINSRDDLNYANALVRDTDFERRRTSLVYVIDRESDVSVRPLAEYSAVAELDEVVVVAAHSWPALAAAAQLPKVRLINANPGTPPGTLLRLGCDAASGDILVLGFGDDTFAPVDITKFLAYLRDADMVIGTRTTRQLIEQGTNMRGIVRAAHMVLAKLLALLWWRFDYRFSDICCMYRALWRSTYTAVRDQLRAPGLEIYPEIVVEVVRARRRIVEIPINYYNRDVRSEYVRSDAQRVASFVRVVWLMVSRRLEELGLVSARASVSAGSEPRAQDASSVR